MLQIVHKYKNSVLGILIFGTVAFVMGGFGVDFLGRNKTPYAIRVNNRDFSYDEVTARRRAIEQRYRQMFGKNYSELMKTFKIDSKQQAIDNIIADAVIEQFAQSQGFFAGRKEVAEIIRTQLFQGGFDPQQYERFLNDQGLTAQQFETALQADALRTQIAEAINAASTPSRAEVKVTIERRKTKYSLDSVELDPAAYLKSADAPSDKEIEDYYNEHTSDFTNPAKIAYKYAILDPKDFENSVEVTSEDIQLYYDDHQIDYQAPEELRAREIVFNIPANADEKARAEIKKSADAVLAKAKDGTSFESLAKQYSNDTASAMQGGELGWIKRGERDKAFDDAAFKLLEGEISGVVELPGQYVIIKAEEEKPAHQLELSDVRAQIEEALRKREAPAYAAVKTSEYYDEWSRGSETLTQYALSKGFKVAETNGELTKDTDPDPMLKGLTAETIENPDETKKLVDLGQRLALVAVKNYTPAQPAPLSEVKDAIIKTLRNSTASALAKEQADKLLSALSSDAGVSSLKDAATKAGLTITPYQDVTQDNVKGPLVDAQVQAALFSSSKELEKPTKYYQVNGRYLLFQVTSINRPSADEVNSEIEKLLPSETKAQSNLIWNSLIENLKARAKIDISPSLMMADR